MLDNTFVLEIPESRSSYIKKIIYDEDEELLTIYIRPFTSIAQFSKVPRKFFDEFSKVSSIGKFYHGFIKPNFKQVKITNMADQKDRPKTKNQASDQKRFIKMSINVQEIKKEFLIQGEKGVYLAMTLQMLPDGKLDKFGNLGMITQDVPKEIYEKEKNLPKEQKTQGPILGNGAELDWGEREGQPGVQSGHAGVTSDVADDLPF